MLIIAVILINLGWLIERWLLFSLYLWLNCVAQFQKKKKEEIIRRLQNLLRIFLHSHNLLNLQLTMELYVD